MGPRACPPAPSRAPSPAGSPSRMASISPRVRASGAHGRILARDIENARMSAAPTPPAAVSADRVKALYEGRPYEEVPLDAMRRTIATRLVEAAQTVPHFHLSADVDFDRLEEIRAGANGGASTDAEGRPSFRLTVSDFVVKALAVALQRVPAANAVWAGDRIIRFSASDIAVAVAVEGGLITPVDPLRRNEIGDRHLGRAEEPRGPCPRQKTRSTGNPRGRHHGLEPRHVRRARVHGDHQPAAVDDPRGRRRRPAAGRDPEDGGIALRHPRRR